MKNSILILFFISLVIGSCNENKQEVLDLNDVIPTSDNYKEGQQRKDTSATIIANVNTGLDAVLLGEHKIILEKLAANDSLLFPDRFSPIHSSKFMYSMENQDILFANYRFKDSTKTKNVFLNWTNCFGPKCKSLGIGESSNLQRDGFVMLANDTSIVYVASNSSAEQKKWISYFTKEKDVQWRYILTQSKGGKVKWNTFKQNKLTPIESKKIQIE